MSAPTSNEQSALASVTLNGIARNLTVTGTLRAQSRLGILGRPATARLGR